MIKIEKKESLGQGRFIKLERLYFTDEKKHDRTWESCSRINSCGAVIIVPLIVPDNEYVLVRQFRPPTCKYVLEFPAGLIDVGEDLTTAAVRELMEETGYEGRITEYFAPGFSSPGLSCETAGLVFMEIDGVRYRNMVPQTFQEETENIEIFRVKRPELFQFLTDAIKRGDGIDNKLWPFAYFNK